MQKQPQRRRWRTLAVISVLLVVIGAGTVTALALTGKDRVSSASPDNDAATGVATVTRQDLAAQTDTSGTLGYTGTYAVTSRLPGTVTLLPKAGTVVQHGTPLYWVDGRPILLLEGSVPSWRALARGMKGADVRQLNAELVALGLAPTSVRHSTTFSWTTYRALRKLQHEAGLKRTGELELGRVVFLPVTQLRVTSLLTVLGSSVAGGSPVLTATSTGRQVKIALDVSRRSLIKVGDAVTVTLPGDVQTPGRIASIGAVATTPLAGNATVSVSVRLRRPPGAGTLDQAPVSVSITSGTAKDALAVPVTALLALAGGGYAVEVITGTQRTLVAAELGLFDDRAGRVEIRGAGLRAGQQVVVPAS